MAFRIPRYTAGRSNIRELEQQAASAITPAEAAAAESAPFRLVTDVSDSAGRAIEVARAAKDRVQQSKNKVDLSNIKNRQKAALLQAENEAKENNWDAETFNKRVESILEGTDAAIAGLGDERFRELAAQEQAGQRTIFEAEADSIATQIEAKATVDAWNQGSLEIHDTLQNTAPEHRNYETLRDHIRVGQDAGVMTETQEMERLLEVDNFEEGNQLFLDYRTAVENQTEDVFLAGLADQAIPDQAMQVFQNEKKQFDNLVKGAQAEAAKIESRARELRIYQWQADPAQLSATTTDEEIAAFGEREDFTPQELRTSLVIRDKRLAALSETLDPNMFNYRNEQYRDFVDDTSLKLVGENYQARVDWQIENAGYQLMTDAQTGELSMVLGPGALGNLAKGYFTNAIHQTAGDFAIAAGKFEKMWKNNPQIHTDLDSDVQKLYTDYFRLQRSMGGDPEADARAAGMVFAMRREGDNDKAVMGTGEYDSNHQLIVSNLRERLEETALYSADEGFLWFDKNAPFTPEMMDVVHTLGRDYAGWQMVTQGRVDYGDVLDHIGTWLPERISLTEINKGIPSRRRGFIITDEGETVFADEDKIGFEYIVDGAALEEADWARGVLEQELVGQEVLIDNQTFTVVEATGSVEEMTKFLGGAIGYAEGERRTIPLNMIVVADGGGRTNEFGQTLFALRTTDNIQVIQPDTGRTWDWTPEPTPTDKQANVQTTPTLTDVSEPPPILEEGPPPAVSEPERDFQGGF